MVTCRCGHGRGVHKRASGKKRLPCQQLVRQLQAGWSTPTMAVGDRWVTAACRCRDYVPAPAPKAAAS